MTKWPGNPVLYFRKDTPTAADIAAAWAEYRDARVSQEQDWIEDARKNLTGLLDLLVERLNPDPLKDL